MSAFSLFIAIALFIACVAAYRTQPLGQSFDTFGCEILDADLEHLTDAQFDEVHKTLLDCKLLVVRNQKNLSIQGQREFSQRLGVLRVHLESASRHPVYPDVNLVSNVKDSKGAYTGLTGLHVEHYHSDLSWSTTPTKITTLFSEIRPDDCGDTEFVDGVAAYEALSPKMKEMLAGLRGQYSYLKQRFNKDGTFQAGLTEEELKVAMNPTIHPIVTVHPVTGKKNIFANPAHTVASVGMERDESDAILNFLYEHLQKFKITYTWQDKDIAIWDNRAVQHRATGCPDDKPRQLTRTTINNDIPPSDDEVVVIGNNYDLSLDRINQTYKKDEAKQEL